MSRSPEVEWWSGHLAASEGPFVHLASDWDAVLAFDASQSLGYLPLSAKFPPVVSDAGIVSALHRAIHAHGSTGSSWAALLDNLQELDWLPAAKARVLIVERGDRALKLARFDVLMEVLEASIDHWRASNAQLHVVLCGGASLHDATRLIAVEPICEHHAASIRIHQSEAVRRVAGYPQAKERRDSGGSHEEVLERLHRSGCPERLAKLALAALFELPTTTASAIVDASPTWLEARRQRMKLERANARDAMRALWGNESGEEDSGES